MLTRLDVKRVLEAFATVEWTYWKEHYKEWMLFSTHPFILKAIQHPHGQVDPAVLWDGFRWHYVRCLIRAHLWEDLKTYIEGMQETHLREQMQTVIQFVSPRLFYEVWGYYDPSPEFSDYCRPFWVREE